MIIEEKEKTCPYTGLRSFTEEESVYFRGRDEQIEKSTLQLGKNKFLMVTGASGDGKSSIIYAGMIPYLKAGFLKTDYTRWAVADFRPERDPLGNFVKSLSRNFDNVSPATLKTELSRGFSSLIMLYKNSPLYVDPKRKEWVNASEGEKKTIRREAANLFILVDQFEEFFTNPENYRSGVASEEASLVVSTLLETARIALKENLPIYIVFTMRSDYIGQCVAFRGLPEFIGFSQFFIPRLNREEIKMVIREPAEFGGFQITDRLVERLLYDLEEGIDQLPILQHTLSRIWHFASARNEPMDLIHYAMAGGISASELLPEDQAIFSAFLTTIPVEVRAGYDRAGLRNILDLHANSLYNDAYHATSDLDKKNISVIIQTTFKCLTKIDEDRAVRNRMTLREITDIINHPEITAQRVSAVLKAFREPGTTFLKPYIDETQEDANALLPDDVLDITHESLIRNWQNLEHWAKQEHNHYKVYQELRNDLNHWINNGYSSNFLLGVGTLNYFEEWKDAIKPNAHWINRYEKIDNPEVTVDESQSLLNQVNKFLRKSVWKNIVSRTILRHGMQNIVTALVALSLVISCSLLFISSRKNQNVSVVERLKQEGVGLLSSPVVKEREKAMFLISLYRQDSTAFYAAIQQMTDVRKRLNMYQTIIGSVNGTDSRFSGYFMRLLYSESIKDFDVLLAQSKSEKDIVSTIELLIKFELTAQVKATFNDHPDFNNGATELLRKCISLAMQLIESPEKYNSSGLKQKHLHYIIENALTAKILDEVEVNGILKKISIFENPGNKDFQFYKTSSTLEVTNLYSDPLKKGIFQLLGQVYSHAGNLPRAKQCFDSLMAANNTYYSSPDPTVSPSRAPHSLSINFLRTGFYSEFQEFNKYMSAKAKTTTVEYYIALLANTGWRQDSRPNYEERVMEYFFLNLDDLSEEQSTFLYNSVLKEIDNSDLGSDEKSFQLAKIYKWRGLYLARYFLDKKYPCDTVRIKELFAKSYEYFQKCSSEFLSKTNDFADFDIAKNNGGNIRLTNRDIYIYPDKYKTKMFSNKPLFTSRLFFDFLMETNPELYDKNNGHRNLGLWFVSWQESALFGGSKGEMPKELYHDIYRVIAKNERDTNLIYVPLLKLVTLNLNDSILEKSSLLRLERSDLQRLLKFHKEGQEAFWNPFNEILMDNMTKYFPALIKKEGPEVISEVSLSTDYLRNDYLLLRVMLQTPARIYDNNLYKSYFVLIDSAYSSLYKFRDNTKYFVSNPEFQVIEGLMKMEDYTINNIVFQIIKESDDGGIKIDAYRKRIKALMSAGDYYYAFEAIPSTLSSTYNMIFFRRVLDDYREKVREQAKDEWSEYDVNYKRSYIWEN